MAFMDEMTEQEVNRNKAIRGYIIRSLAKGYNYSLYVVQLTNMVASREDCVSGDISKHLAYLEEGGYIAFTERTVNAYNAYRRDGTVKLTKSGIDLLEGTKEDPGIDV